VTATASSRLPQDGMEVDPGLKDAGNLPPNIISLRSSSSPAVPERVPAFSINGTLYTIATRTKTNIGLKYIHLARTKGREIAVDFMLETLLGEDGYEALMDFEDLTEQNLTDVINAASRIMAGAVEVPKDKPAKGSRKSAG
jgi:hypothetical protein